MIQCIPAPPASRRAGLAPEYYARYYSRVAGVIQLVECQLPKLDLQAEASSSSSGSSDLRDERDTKSPIQVQAGCTSQVQSGPGDPVEVEPSRRGPDCARHASANLPIRR